MPTYLGHTIQNGTVSGPFVNTTLTTIYPSGADAQNAVFTAVNKVISANEYDLTEIGYNFDSPTNVAILLKLVTKPCAECLTPVINGSENTDNMGFWSEDHNDHICSECYMLQQSFENECVTVQEACTYLERNFSESQTWNTDEGIEQFCFEFGTDCDYPVALLLVYLTSSNGDSIMRSFGPDECTNINQFAVENLSNLEEWGV